MMKLHYKGFITTPQFDGEGYFGKIENVTDLVTIEADSLEDFQHEFHEAVEDYVVFRQSLPHPEIPFITKEVPPREERRLAPRMFVPLARQVTRRNCTASI